MYNLVKCILFAFVLFSSSICSAQYWSVKQTVANRIIWNLEFSDQNTIYAVGNRVLMKSTDAGNTWIDLMPNLMGVTTDSIFANLKFLNKDTGFIFRNFSLNSLLRTTDGGQTWTDVSSPAMPFGMFDMDFVTPLIGYATGGFMDSVIAKTTDGGQTWTHVPSPPNVSPLAIKFLNDSTGFAGNEIIYKTTNSGQTWIPTNTPNGWNSTNRVSNYYFINDQIGFALTEEWIIYKTIDGGLNWIPIAMSVLPNTGSCYNFSFDQDFFGYCMGYAINQPFISLDGGQSWVIDASFPVNLNAVSIAISKDHKVIIGTSSGEVVIRNNGPLNAQEFDALNEVVVYPNPSQGIVTLTNAEHVSSFFVVNLVGQEVANSKGIKLAIPTLNLDLNSLPKGIYILHMNGNNKSRQQKIILE